MLGDDKGWRREDGERWGRGRGRRRRRRRRRRVEKVEVLCLAWVGTNVDSVAQLRGSWSMLDESRYN